MNGWRFLRHAVSVPWIATSALTLLACSHGTEAPPRSSVTPAVTVAAPLDTTPDGEPAAADDNGESDAGEEAYEEPDATTTKLGTKNYGEQCASTSECPSDAICSPGGRCVQGPM